MSPEFSKFATRLRRFISQPVAPRDDASEILPPKPLQFDPLALDLFRLQFEHNEIYRRFCERRQKTPETVAEWSDIPAIPSVAYKEFEMTCLPPQERTRIFHSSGTTSHLPSRHFHSADSLAIYEASLLPWFEKHLLGTTSRQRLGRNASRMICLTPNPDETPQSSLAHMFGAVLRQFGRNDSRFVGRTEDDGWILNRDCAMELLQQCCDEGQPVILLGTAFLFVHLLDYLCELDRRICLPIGSRIMETGGYKGRSRGMAKSELYTLMTRTLGIPASHIVSEYGMSELSSQAYDRVIGANDARGTPDRTLRFPPWTQVVIVSPETGKQASIGERGLIRIFDLANVYSVMAIQTEDLAISRHGGFELIGRAAQAEPRGCSLMAV